MADRLSFRFVRLAKVVSIGDVKIDVNDPFNKEEIQEKLKQKDFVSLLFTDNETEDEHWQFFPVEDNEEYQYPS